jgi:outer membrane protein assembly factor BamA
MAVYYQMLHQKLGMELVGETIEPGSRRPATIEAGNANSIGAFWDYLHLEGGSNPAKGVEFNLRYRYQNGADKRFHAAVEAGTKGYIPLGLRFVGFVGVQIRNLDNEQAAAWEQFKMGGYGTLRGYHEDEFSSFRLAWTNYELRYRFSPDSRAYIFFDQGFLAKDKKSLKTDIFGIGAGMKVKTRLGILGLEYGLGYRDKSFSRMGLGMIHAGLDVAF